MQHKVIDKWYAITNMLLWTEHQQTVDNRINVLMPLGSVVTNSALVSYMWLHPLSCTWPSSFLLYSYIMACLVLQCVQCRVFRNYFLVTLTSEKLRMYFVFLYRFPCCLVLGQDPIYMTWISMQILVKFMVSSNEIIQQKSLCSLERICQYISNNHMHLQFFLLKCNEL
jgi:hypothetical protein